MNCPMCGEDSQHAFRPFCSKRCADRDLGKWFNGSYSVPAQEPEAFEEPEEIQQPAPPRPH